MEQRKFTSYELDIVVAAVSKLLLQVDLLCLEDQCGVGPQVLTGHRPFANNLEKEMLGGRVVSPVDSKLEDPGFDPRYLTFIRCSLGELFFCGVTECTFSSSVKFLVSPDEYSLSRS